MIFRIIIFRCHIRTDGFGKSRQIHIRRESRVDTGRNGA